LMQPKGEPLCGKATPDLASPLEGRIEAECIIKEFA